MTAAVDRPPARRAPVRTPRAILTGAVFQNVDGVQKFVRKLRGGGATEDIIGFAIPLGGDPADPETPRRLLQNRKRGFSPIRFLMTVIDPHAPGPDYRQRVAGQNSELALPLLGDLARWFVGVKVFRIPSIAVGDPQDPGAGGAWVLGHPNHASAVNGMEGAARGGSVGALATVGVPEEHAATGAARLFEGQIVLTTCQTDEGRAKRDEKLLRKCGADLLFAGYPLYALRRVQA